MRDPGYQPITAREDKISTNKKPAFHPFLNPVVFTPVITTNKHSVIVSVATSYNVLKYFWSLFKYCLLTWWWPRRMDCPPVNCWYSDQPRTSPRRKRLEVPCRTTPWVHQTSQEICLESVSHQQAENISDFYFRLILDYFLPLGQGHCTQGFRYEQTNVSDNSLVHWSSQQRRRIQEVLVSLLQYFSQAMDHDSVWLEERLSETGMASHCN